MLPKIIFLHHICFEESTFNCMSLHLHNSCSRFELLITSYWTVKKSPDFELIPTQCINTLINKAYILCFHLIEPEIDEGVAGDVCHGEDVTHEEQDGGMARGGARVPVKGLSHKMIFS